MRGAITYSHGGGRFSVWNVQVQIKERDGVFVWCEREGKSDYILIHHGRAVGLWASRETLENGLGKGKVN